MKDVEEVAADDELAAYEGEDENEAEGPPSRDGPPPPSAEAGPPERAPRSPPGLMQPTKYGGERRGDNENQWMCG